MGGSTSWSVEVDVVCVCIQSRRERRKQREGEREGGRGVGARREGGREGNNVARGQFISLVQSADHLPFRQSIMYHIHNLIGQV